MTNLISIFAASALALSLSGMAFAADEKTQNQPAYPKAQDQTGAPKTQEQGAAPTDSSKQNLEYLVAMKKCQDMQGAEREECIEQAKQKYNRM